MGLQNSWRAFVFLALDVAGRNLGAASRAQGFVLPALFFGAALLSKEVAVALLPWTAAWAFAARGRPEAAARWRLAGVFAAITAVYLAVRIGVLGGLAQPPENAPSFARACAAVPVALLTYLRLLVAPLGFSFFRPERPEYAFSDPAVAIAVAVLVALLLASIWAIRSVESSSCRWRGS